MEEKRITDKQMSSEVKTILDEIVTTGKKAARSFLNLMVERTSQTANDLVDKKVDCLKQKINEKDTDEKKSNE